MEQHETLAAFRVRFSGFQEHPGKTIRAIAIEETDPGPNSILSVMLLECLAAEWFFWETPERRFWRCLVT